jgi:peptidoglycan/xylan/chitin deacetylase (PgdA/CDA1 family)
MGEGFTSLFGRASAHAFRVAFANAKDRFGEPRPFPAGYERCLCRRPGGARETALYLDRLIAPEPGGEVLFEIQRPSGMVAPLLVRYENQVLALADLERVIEDHLKETYHRPPPALSTRIPFDYRKIPPGTRHWIHRGVVTWRKTVHQSATRGVWPEWDLETLVLRWLKRLGVEPRVDEFPQAIALTHDVDGAEQLGFALETARAENNAGVRACYYIPAEVIAGHKSEIREIADLGHEIGVHGLRHDNRQLEAEPGAYVDRLRSEIESVNGLKTSGYRAPSLRTSPALRTALAQMFAYDSSLPSTDVFSEAGLHHGCGVARPYRTGGGVELPINLPLDDRLITLGHHDPMPFWREGCTRLWKRGVTPVLLTHTNDRFYPQGFGTILQALVQVAKQHGARFITPMEIIENSKT